MKDQEYIVQKIRTQDVEKQFRVGEKFLFFRNGFFADLFMAVLPGR
jgi:hypothetical protein